MSELLGREAEALRVIEAARRVHGGCAPETCGGSRLDPCELADALNAYNGPGAWRAERYPPNTVGAAEQAAGPAPEWVSTTFLHIEKGDRLRLGADEAQVLAVSKLEWHADVSDPYRPKPWKHTEVRADVGFGMTNFPPGTAVEVLCDAERKAQLIMSEAGLKPRYQDAEES